MVEAGDLKTYFARARLWEQDQLTAAYRSKRLAWGVAGGACLLSVVSVGAVAALSPLKSVEPFVVRVDNATGIVDVVSGLNAGPTSYDEAVTKYFLGQYVRLREGYSFVEAPVNFRTVSLLSSGPEQVRFATLYKGSNPESPQVAFGRSGIAEIRIKAISLLGPHLASVRYLRESRRGDETKVSHWIATLAFGFEPKAKMSTSDRLVNPLGFLVSEYRSDPEVAP
ncbi:conjugal transfer protein TraJ [Methylobacterium radiotolerans]|jgi:type IV secretion system protein VirB8|nr:conjugal transfer protein TraJ [Methylobacterium radiotolerans]